MAGANFAAPVRSGAEAEAMFNRYSETVDMLLAGTLKAGVEVPWHDLKFVDLFQERARENNRRLQRAVDDAQKWGALKELVSHIGTAAK